jgi:uncharacterized OB-fold protein
VSTTEIPDIFIPQPTVDSEFYWAGLRENKLLVPFCTACNRHFFPPMPGCPLCSADKDKVEPREVSGEATVYSWVVAHYAFDPVFKDEVPYTILTVDLAEGPRINARFRGDPDSIQAGMRVKAEYEDRGPFTMLYFAPVEA